MRYFAQYGVTRGVAGIATNLRGLRTSRPHPSPPVPGIAVVSHSARHQLAVTADMCGQAGLDLPTLGPEARDGINGSSKASAGRRTRPMWTGFANSGVLPPNHGAHDQRSRMGRSSWRAPGRTPRPTKSSDTRDSTDKGVGVPVDRKAATPNPACPSSRALGSRSSTRRTNWPAACRAAAPITPGASVAGRRLATAPPAHGAAA